MLSWIRQRYKGVASVSRLALLCLCFFSVLSSNLRANATNEQTVLSSAISARQLTIEGKYNQAYEKAQQALLQSLEVLDQPHLYTAVIHDDLAKTALLLRDLDSALGHSENSERLLLEIGEPALEFLPDIRFNKAVVLMNLGRYNDAQVVFKTVYVVRKRNSGKPEIASVAQSLGFTYLQLEMFEDAEKKLLESIDLWSIDKDVYGVAINESKISLARIPLFQGDAEATLQRVSDLKMHESDRLTPPQLLRLYSLEVDALIVSSRFSEAQASITQAEEFLESNKAISSVDRSRISYSKGLLATLKGDPIQSEKYFRRTLVYLVQTESRNHPVVLRAMQGLAIANKNLGALSEADVLFADIVKSLKTNMGERHISVAMTLAEYSRILSKLRFHARAISASEEARSIVSENTEDREFESGIADVVLGFALKASGDLKAAQPYFTSGIRSIARARGNGSTDLPPGLLALAEISLELDDYKKADDYVSQALRIINDHSIRSPERSIHANLILAKIQVESGNCNEAYKQLDKAIGHFKEYSEKSVSSIGTVHDMKTEHDRVYILQILNILASCGELAEAENIAFEALQLPQLTSTSSGIGISKVIHSNDNLDLSALIEKREALSNDQRVLNARMSGFLLSSGGDNINESELNRLNKLSLEISEVDEKLISGYPEYASLVNPAPVSIEQLQKIVKSNEAMLLQFTAEDSTYLAMVFHDEVVFANSDLSIEEQAVAVESIRSSLQTDFEASLNSTPAFDFVSAHLLYQKILGPFEKHLLENNVEHIVLVPDGAAQRIPFGLFVTSLPRQEPQTIRSVGNLDFLIRKYSLSVLPSANSAIRLSELDTAATRADVQGGFIGFGDPVFDDLKRLDTRSSSQFLKYAESKINVEQLSKSFGRIEETADELKLIGSLFDDDQSDLYLDHEATESNVKQASLKNYSILAFATHGVMADEFANLREPALIFTPPDIFSETDDGLLTASEIANLDLDADWVILSACNTASPIPEQGADGLSGLARSFFYAGARSLLVTHWQVESYSVQLLSTNAIKNWLTGPASPSRSESLRKSILYLLEGEEGSRYTHPFFWAPFSNVGLR